jgi:hypothetical protein
MEKSGDGIAAASDSATEDMSPVEYGSAFRMYRRAAAARASATPA